MILIFTQAFCHMCVENLLKGFATPRACQAYMFFYIHCISKAWRMSESSFSHLFIAVFPFSFVSNATNLFFQQVCFKKTAAYTLLVLFNWMSFLFLAKIWKIKKRGGSMVQGQVFLKGRCWHFSYLFFSSFIFFTFRNYFTLCKIELYI